MLSNDPVFSGPESEPERGYGPVVSVIVPCRGHADVLRKCLAGLERQIGEIPCEVVVVDAEADPAVAEATSEFPRVRLVRSTEGLLPGGARNLGVRHSRADLLAFIDADCVPEPGWLAAAVDALVNGAELAGGPVLDENPLHPVAAADNLLQFYEQSRHRRGGRVLHLPGCNVAVTKDAFYENGGFPTDLEAGEDSLFTHAVATRWPERTRFVPEMRVRHRGRDTLRALWRHQDVFGFHRGRLRFLMRPLFQRWGRNRVLALLLSGLRLPHIVVRTARWNPAGLFRVLLLLPWLLFGLAAWGIGLRRGCVLASEECG